jgi:predicted nucleic acid-binding protein
VTPHWLLDTNVVLELVNPACDPAVRAWFVGENEASFGLSVMTLAEVEQGIAGLPKGDARRPRYEAQRAAIEARFGSHIVQVDLRVARRFGHLSGLLRRAGCKAPVIDTLLAATAIEHGLVLVTRNTKDVAATGAKLLDPWQSAESL